MTARDEKSSQNATFRDHGGEMGALIRAHDWKATSLGPIESWHQSLKTLVDLMLGSLQPVYIGWGPDTLSLYNDAYIPILGDKHPRALGRPFRETFSEIWDEYRQLLEETLAGVPHHFRDQPVALAGRHDLPLSWFTFSWTPVRDDRGEIAGFFCAAVETTDRVRAGQALIESKEAAVRASEARYRTLFDAIESGFCIVEVDPGGDGGRIDYRVIEANPAFYEQTGFPQEIFGRWLREAAPALEEHWYETYGRVARTGEPLRFEQHSDHLGRWFDVYAFPAGAVEERCVAILFNDVSARRSAEERLRELNETLERRVQAAIAERDRAWNNARDLLLVADRQGYFHAVNPAWSALLGWDETELVGRHVFDLVHPDDRALSNEALSTAAAGPLPVMENRCRHKDGSYRWISWVAAPEDDFIYGSGRDVTAEKEREAELAAAQEALKQSQKMEAVGQLTGGIAHDFNNLLGAVVSGFDLIRRRPDDPERVRMYAEAGLQAAERGARLTGQLLTFSRAQKIEMKPLVVADLIEGMRDLLTSTLGPMVQLGFDLDADRLRVLCDPVQLEMAVLNLAINARDAMPEGGRLAIGTAMRRLQGDAELKPGDYLVLSVDDTGNGMPPEVVSRAFDPFFTTKGIGKGTGLGLSQVYGIARQAGGTARIDSQPGRGTVVRVYLPRTDEAADGTVQETGDDGHEPPAFGTTVLVVDDDDDVRGMTIAQLEELGYRAIEAADGKAGLAAIDRMSPDLLIVDFAMPGMNGAEMVKEMRRTRPGLPVVFASGYADTAALQAAAGPDALVLRKPFRVRELQAALHKVFSGRKQ